MFLCRAALNSMVKIQIRIDILLISLFGSLLLLFILKLFFQLDGKLEKFKNEDIAREIGYPIIVTAASGGGGRGMRIVNNEEEFEIAFTTAKSEAKISFNDSNKISEHLSKFS